MVQGTASGVGKSVLCAGLCRLLARRGVRVAPFKPQNMSNNAAVTVDGGEIGRAQALQAFSCGIAPVVDMNPILIKPESDETAQLVLRGRATGRLEAHRFRQDRRAWLDLVVESYHRLARNYDRIIVEGAGSCAEPNLRDGDCANMGFATAADLLVWIVGDIDRGGVFAALRGCLDTLATADRARVGAVVVNRFRGHRPLLDDALVWLERACGTTVAGVVPWLPLDLPEEDAPYRHLATVESPSDRAPFRVVAVSYPYASNLDDLDPLAAEAGVTVRLVRTPGALVGADVVILPGSKQVARDLAWLRRQGFVEGLLRHLRYGGRLVGLCGGLQMLSTRLVDDAGIEGGSCLGLGLLPVTSRMGKAKRLARIDATARWPAPVRVTGYEIHHGTTEADPALFPFVARSADGQVWGSYLHGLFASGVYRRAWLRAMDGPAGDGMDHEGHTLASLDRLADALEAALRPDLLAPLLERGVAA